MSGTPNMITCLFALFIVVIVPVWLSLFLRKKYPERLWIGIILSFLFPLFSQLYVKGSAVFIIIIFLSSIIYLKISGEAKSLWIWLCAGVLSAAIMYYRLKKNINKKNYQ